MCHVPFDVRSPQQRLLELGWRGQRPTGPRRRDTPQAHQEVRAWRLLSLRFADFVLLVSLMREDKRPV